MQVHAPVKVSFGNEDEVRNIGINIIPSAAYIDVAEVVDAPGGIELLLGDHFAIETGAVVIPAAFEWQLLYGASQCFWETVPVAQGGTFFAQTPLAREGVLFRVSGVSARSWLLRARGSGIVGAYRVKISMVARRIHPYGFAGAPTVSIGNMIG